MTAVDTGEWAALLDDLGMHADRDAYLAEKRRRRDEARAARMANDNVWHVDHEARWRRDRRTAWLAWLAAFAACWVSWETSQPVMVLPLGGAALAAVTVFAWRSGGRIQAEEDHAASGCPRQVPS